MTELRPCPFCGSDQLHVEYDRINRCDFVYCFDCGSSFRNNCVDSKLAEAWNRRADDLDRDELLEVADQLESIITGDSNGFMNSFEVMIRSMLRVQANRIREVCGIKDDEDVSE